MKLVSIKIESMGNIATQRDVLILIGKISGECYGSSMEDNKCIKRAINCIKRGHHSPWEHYNVTLKCTVDRGVSHALVRHRHCAFQQSSTIYQKFNELCFIDHFADKTGEELEVYSDIEKTYIDLVKNKCLLPQRARGILPNDLATNLVITTNIRQWMYMIQRRAGYGDTTNMHVWRDTVYEWFNNQYPDILQEFKNWYAKHPL